MEPERRYLTDFVLKLTKPVFRRVKYSHTNTICNVSNIVSGAPCTDSLECADQCCRRIRMGRMGYFQKCGKPFGDACVGKVFSPNDIFYD